MTDADHPVLSGLMGVYENAQKLMEKAAAEIKDDTLKTFNEVHESFALAKGMNERVRDANAKFRAFLGLNSNFPPKDAAALEDKSGGRADGADQ